MVTIHLEIFKYLFHIELHVDGFCLATPLAVHNSAKPMTVQNKVVRVNSLNINPELRKKPTTTTNKLLMMYKK